MTSVHACQKPARSEDHTVSDTPPRAILRVLTTETPENTITVPQGPVCDDTYRCPCLTCQAARARAVKQGSRGSGPQPWEPRVRRAA